MFKLVSKGNNTQRSPPRVEGSPGKGVLTQRGMYITLNSPRQEVKEKASPSPGSHNKTKIKIVSPLRRNQDAGQSKENSPARDSPTRNISPFKPTLNIELGGKATEKRPEPINLNDLSRISIDQHLQPNPKVHPNPPSKKYSNFVIMGCNNPIPKSKGPSPQKVSINSKPFDLGSLQSQIIYVTPFRHVRSNSDQSTQRFQIPIPAPSNRLPHPTIREETQTDSLKQSCQDQLIQITQIRQQLQEDSNRIKQLLNTSRVSKEICVSELLCIGKVELPEQQKQQSLKLLNFEDFPLHHSRMESENRIAIPPPSEKTLINELEFQTDKKFSISFKRKDEVYVQTEDLGRSEKVEARHECKGLKLAITKNLEYQIEAASQNEELEAIASSHELENEEKAQICQVQSVGKAQCEEKEQELPQKQQSEEAINLSYEHFQQSNRPSREAIVHPIESNQHTQLPVPIAKESQTSLMEEVVSLQKVLKSEQHQPTPQPDRHHSQLSTKLPKFNQPSIKQIEKNANERNQKYISYTSRSVKSDSKEIFPKRASTKRSINNSIYL